MSEVDLIPGYGREVTATVTDGQGQDHSITAQRAYWDALEWMVEETDETITVASIMDMILATLPQFDGNLRGAFEWFIFQAQKNLHQALRDEEDAIIDGIFGPLLGAQNDNRPFADTKGGAG